MQVTLEIINHYIDRAVHIIREIKPDYIFPGFKNIYIRDYNSKFWAQINYLNNGEYSLQINTKYMYQIDKEKLLDKCLSNTIIHELIHTISGCESHSSKWLEIAGKINAVHPELKITTINRLEEYINTGKKSPRWKLICSRCGAEWWRYKKPDVEVIKKEYGCPYCFTIEDSYASLDIFRCR